jgi:DNA polymerase
MNDRSYAYLQALGIPYWQLRADKPSSAQIQTLQRTLNSGPSTALADVPSQSPRDVPDITHMGWDELITRVNECGCCDLCKTRTHAVFGIGNRQAELMVIGEAPGAEEDLRGEPFVGRAGKLLDQMLAAIGLNRERVYIANILKCRPPNNRDPLPTEVAACIPYLARQLSLIQPKLILAVGRIAAQTLLATQTPIGKLRGQIHALPQGSALPTGIPLLVTYHPAYLLRSPGDKAKAWQDLKLARAQLQAHSA